MSRIHKAIEKALEIRHAIKENCAGGTIKTDHDTTMEKRKERRYSKRLKVRISSGKLRRSGIMNDISNNGMFVRSGRDFAKDMVLNIELLLPNNRISFLKGIVTRNTGIPGSNWLMGIGIYLTDKDEIFRNFLTTLT
jgi:hypothetical protein